MPVIGLNMQYNHCWILDYCDIFHVSNETVIHCFKTEPEWVSEWQSHFLRSFGSKKQKHFSNFGHVAPGTWKIKSHNLNLGHMDKV